MANNRRLRSARNIFLLNLILTDLLLVLTAVPVTPWYALTKNWQFGSAMCHVMPLSNSCSVFVTSWSLTAISIDKYLHIIDPTKAPVTKRQALAITLLIWLLSTLINVPYLLSYELVDGSYYVPKDSTPYCGKFCDETNWQSENSRRLYGTMVMLLQFVIPMSIITYCYFRILRKVSQDMIIQNVQFSASLSQKQRVDAISRKKKVNYILIGMVATFICCWLPLTAVNLVKDYKIEPAFLRAQPFLWPLMAHVIAMSLVVWNPVLFFWLTRKQKRSGLSKIISSSEAVASFATRLGHSIRRMSSRNDSKIDKTKKRNGTVDADGMSSSFSATSRPLIMRTEMVTATPATGDTNGGLDRL
ncbi:Prolactin-releasing peptide receptor [Trichostrongylus colubriformis]|uniref:Prolactin-releasing peptide receptor n=1 Tax=Trichostrongylus colubriformis TaxID=6319 RepID=A0AAN8FI22_TRICO